MRKQVLIASLTWALLLAAGLAHAGDAVAAKEGRISHGRLQRLGLQSLQVVSDDEGAEVRGSGFASHINWSSVRSFVRNIVQSIRSHTHNGNGSPTVQ